MWDAAPLQLQLPKNGLISRYYFMTSLTFLPQLINVLDHQSSIATVIVGALKSTPVESVNRGRDVYHFTYDIAQEETSRLHMK